jgi:transcriptional regulator with XRE-family HTH domain
MVENDAKLKLERYAEEYANDPEFVAEGLSMKVVELMLKLLNTKGLNQSWLAKEMGVSRAHISKILNAQPNMTFLTFSKIAIALGVEPDVDFKSKPGGQPKSTDSGWLSIDQSAHEEVKTGSILPISSKVPN